MLTTLAKWLSDRDLTPHSFSVRIDLHPRTINRIAGYGRKPYPLRGISFEIVEHVSKATGIPVATLIAEAQEAAKHPEQPRVYHKTGRYCGTARAVRTKREAKG